MTVESLCQATSIGSFTREASRDKCSRIYLTESLILAQNERWQRGLGMQVERDLTGE